MHAAPGAQLHHMQLRTFGPRERGRWMNSAPSLPWTDCSEVLSLTLGSQFCKAEESVALEPGGAEHRNIFALAPPSLPASHFPCFCTPGIVLPNNIQDTAYGSEDIPGSLTK